MTTSNWTPDTDQRWAFSYVTKVALNASASYLIENFPLQSDQTSPLWYWMPTQREGTIRPQWARIRGPVADMTVQRDGYLRGTNCYKVWTPGMFTYLLTNQWASGAADWNYATIKVWDDNLIAYSVIQCYVYRPLPGQDFEYIDDKYVNVKVRWDHGIAL